MKIAALTTVYNESVFLPIWLEHYGSAVGYENLYVIDDGSTDGSALDARIVNRLVKRRVYFDEDDRAALVSYFHQALLRTYDVVIYSDVDEIVVLDPKLGMSLSDYLGSAEFEYKNVIGCNVRQHLKSESDLDLTRPLFQQRRYVEFDLSYCKALVSRVPMWWKRGFHRLMNGEPRYDFNLLLFHLRSMDLEISRSRIGMLNQIVYSPNALARSHGLHFKWTEDHYLNKLFSRPESHFERAYLDFELVPEFLKPAGPPEMGDGEPITMVRVPPRFENCIRLSKFSELPAAKNAPPIQEHELRQKFGEALEKMTVGTRERSRNELCPCGSDKKFKHCHGALK